MRHFISHVKTDSIYIKFPDPFLTDLAEIFDHFFIIRIQFRHRICKCKGVKTPVSGVCSFSDLFPVFYHKPVRITGIFPMLQYIHPRREFSSTMVKYCIYHNTDSFFVRFPAKCFHCFFIAKSRINLCIICSIIFVIGLCFHDRIQINTGNPQLLKIR